MGLTADQILDLVMTAQPSFIKGRYTLLATQLQKYEAMRRIMKKDKITKDNGHSIEKRVMTRDSGTARQTGLFAVRPFSRIDKFTKIVVPWRYSIWSYFWDIRETLMNRGPAQIVDHVKAERVAAFVSGAQLWEEQWWGKPPDSTDTESWYGMQYWVTRAVTTTTTRFSGPVPAGFTTKGGIDPAVVPAWKNWTATYSAISDGDLIFKVREAMEDINWENPIDVEELRGEKGENYRLYMGKTLYLELCLQAKRNNDQVGADLAAMDGKTVIRGNIIKRIPFLDADVEQPLYLTNFNSFYPVVLSGDFLEEDKPMKLPDRPRTQGVDVTTTANVFCEDLREQAVLYKPAA